MHATVELFIRWIHLLAAMIWLSGIFFSLFIVSPILRRELFLVQSYQHMAAIRDRLRIIIHITIHVLLITGAMNVVTVGLNTNMQFSRGYVILLVAKLGFVGLMTVFHSLHISVLGCKLAVETAELGLTDTILQPLITKRERQTQLFAILTILSGLIVFALALSMKNA